MNKFILFIFIVYGQAAFCQQNISGLVRDAQTQEPLVGATVSVLNSKPLVAVTTNEQGFFIIDKMQSGRYILQISYIGYASKNTESILLQSTKASYLELELNSTTIKAEELVVTANKNAFAPLNELSIVSARSFTAEETERIPGGINDPGRVVLSYPGVTIGGDDNENQVIVRGNSPIGILWRLEGIDIPNPNHFAVIGSSGGGVTVFSAQLLSKSDFSTGGFAAEYGNALSAAFDVHFRPGDFTKKEHRFKIGLIGLDFSTEGPINKGRSSYLINYRYSALGLLSALGFNFVGERVTNKFQDLSFNFVFKSKNQKSVSTIFGLGGLSEENYQPVAVAADRNPAIANHWEDRLRPANMAAVGVTNTYRINEKGYVKSVVALVGSDIQIMNDTLNASNERYRYDTQNYIDKRVVSSVTLNQKINENWYLKTGIISNFISFNYLKTTMPRSNTSDINDANTQTTINGTGQTQTYQQYAQVIFEKKAWQLNAGFHYLRLAINKSQSLEPRFAVKYKIKPNQDLSLSYGLHSQMLPLVYYFYKKNNDLINNNLKLLKAEHLVAAYHWYTAKSMRLTLEAYLQKTFNVPTGIGINQNWYMLNYQGNFPEFALESKGSGQNKGLDFALEKMFRKSYYFLINTSLIDAKFKLANGQTFNSKFNTGFNAALTLGKEFYFKKGRILQIGGRYILNGGQRYTPHDPVKSSAQKRYVESQNDVNTLHLPGYKRLDGRISYAYNRPKLAGKINLDVQNALNYSNASSVSYLLASNSTAINYRGSTLTPVLSFQWDF